MNLMNHLELSSVGTPCRPSWQQLKVKRDAAKSNEPLLHLMDRDGRRDQP